MLSKEMWIKLVITMAKMKISGFKIKYKVVELKTVMFHHRAR